jgi:regulator of protease activity HflC (stomatin/prohibitin superfamily)
MSEPKQQSKLPYIATAVIALLLLMAICAFQLRINEVAVVTTFGKPSVVTEPGFQWRLPWPVQQVRLFDNRTHVLAGMQEEITTSDSINLVVRPFLTWRIDDHLKFSKSLGTMTEAESVLRSSLSSLLGSVFVNHKLGDFIGVDRLSGLAQIETEIRQAFEQQLPADYGLAVEFVGVSELVLPADNTNSVIERMKREHAAIAETIRIKGETEANIIRSRADSVGSARLADARAKAQDIRSTAMAEAAESYETFSEDVDFALFLRNLDALEDAMGPATLIVDPSMPPFHMLLPDGGQVKDNINE